MPTNYFSITQYNKKELFIMVEKILSTVAILTILIPFTVVLLWNPSNPNASAILMGYCIFTTISFFYSLFIFLKIHLRNTNTKIALGVNSIYLVIILALVVVPRLINQQ
jgi:hypothetical protein